jgi:hypothetical protein
MGSFKKPSYYASFDGNSIRFFVPNVQTYNGAMSSTSMHNRHGTISITFDSSKRSGVVANSTDSDDTGLPMNNRSFVYFSATPTFDSNNNQLELVFDGETFNPTGTSLTRVTVEYTTR